MIIVEFVDQPTQQTAISNSSKLKGNNKMRKVYINPDLTKSQLLILKDLRKQRNDLNEKIHNETNEGRHWYDVSKKGSKKVFRFHWCIRNMEVVQIFERKETKEARGSQTSTYLLVQEEDSRPGGIV